MTRYAVVPETGAHEQAGALARLLENVEDAIVEVDARFVATHWSKGAERLYGWTAEEVLGRDVGFAVRLDMSDGERAELRRETAARGRSRRDVVALRKDGTRIDVETIEVAVRDRRGELTGYLGIHRDVSERKRHEREIETVLESIADAFVAVDADWRYTYVNEVALRRMRARLGRAVSRDEVIGSEMWATFPDAVGSELHRGYLQAMRERRRVDLETYFEPSGEWIEAHAYPSGDGLSIVYRDVTDRKRAELRRTESQLHAETILESVTDAFYALDREWRFRYLNARAVQHASLLAGEQLTRDGLLGRTLWETLPAIVGTPIEDEYRRALRERQPAAFEYAYPGGRPVFEVRAYPSEQGLAIYFRDVTEANEREQERATRARQDALLAELGLRALASHDLPALLHEASALVGRTLDAELTAIAEVLPGGEALLLTAGVGWEDGAVGTTTGRAGRGSLVGYTVMSGVPVTSANLANEDRFRVPESLLRDGVVSAMSVVIAGRDGPFGALGVFSTRPRSFSQDALHFAQAVANIVATAIERSRASERLIDVRDAERRRIARDLHDDALQDLAYALAEADLPLSAPDGSEAAQRLSRLVPALRRVGEQLRGAVYDLRLAGDEARTFRDLLEALVDVHRAMAPACQIVLDLEDGPWPGSLGRTGTEVLRIVGEALTNSRRHAGAGHADVRVRATEHRLRAEVSDDGRGFAAVSAAASATSDGITGMRERAHLLGGELDVASRPGGGTAVRLDIPLRKDGERPAVELRVLLVEDHAAVREAIAATFQREAGFEIVGQAASLGEARALLLDIDVDVAILDLGLPDGYGADLIDELRERNPRAQALVLSASVDRADIAAAVQRGAAGVLNKAERLDDIVAAVRRLRAGETLLPVAEVVELLQFAGRRRVREQADRQAIAQLTPREHEVLQALADGLDSRQVAERLFISIRTERNHVANILGKLGVHSQLQALLFALRYDVVQVQ